MPQNLLLSIIRALDPCMHRALASTEQVEVHSGPVHAHAVEETPAINVHLKVQLWICAFQSEQQIVWLTAGLCDARRDVWTDL
ncbi:hypothetical protein F2P79_019539 [Pimephales promelas]|nr:hypothetical protein F2P79_019539 [Pimephales promelas]